MGRTATELWGRRVVVLTTSYPREEGDYAGHFVQAEARAMQRRGARVQVVAAGGKLSDPVVIDRGVKVWRCGGGDAFAAPGIAAQLRHQPWRAGALPAFARGARAHLRAIGPCDEVHAHWLVPCGWPLAPYARATTRYAIAHGGDVRLLLGLPTALRAWLLRRLLAHHTRLRFVAAALRDDLCAALPPPLAQQLWRRSSVSPCAIEVARVRGGAELRRHLGIAARRPFIVWVGRLVRDKRLSLLVRALAMMPAPPLCLVVGAGPARVNIEALIEQHQLPVRLLGALPRQLTLDIIAAAGLLVSCSRHEGAPTVVREARALGTAVVTTAAGDVARWAQTDGGIRLVLDTTAALSAAIADGLSTVGTTNMAIDGERVRRAAASSVMDRAMTQPIRRVAVLGAGVMGSGIAAHIANAGVAVLLLDIVPPNLSDEAKKSKAARDGFAAGALKKLQKSKPAAFTHQRNQQLISIGNFDDDLPQVAECDLIIEAIIERLDIKRGLFEKLDNLLKGDTIIASNTSGLRIVDMLQGRSQHFRQRFLVTHFFNPPRYMKLLELVRSPDTADEVATRLEHFGQDVLGKGIVYAKDTPNFIANRIGAHAMMATIHLMLEKGVTPEDIDQICGLPMGHPKSATFRTADVVGLDTLAHVVDNCYEVLTDDEARDTFKMPSYVRTMIARGQIGQKAGGGFYRKGKAGIETLDPTTGEYRPRGGDKAIRAACKALAGIEDAATRVRKLVATEGIVGDIAWAALSTSLAYAANRMGEISDDIAALDDGMRWGYNWQLGPFETWDALGFQETTQRMLKEGISLPASINNMLASGATGFYDQGRVYNLLEGKYLPRKSDARNLTLKAARAHGSMVLENNSAEAWDIGDGVLAVTFKSKANSLDADNIQMLHDAAARAEKDFRGIVLFNQGDNFCVGANLFLVAAAAAQKQWAQIDSLVKSYQAATQRLKYALVPVVAAPYGMTLGGGLELCMGSDAVQAACETYAGLVEVGVGLIPGGAGTLNMLWRSLSSVPEGVAYDSYAFVTQVFKNIAMAKVATSAQEAKELGFFRHSDGVSFDRARHLYEAKQRVIGMANSGYHAPIPRAFKLPGESGIATLSMMVDTLVAGGFASPHDALIARKLANVLCGGAAGGSGLVSEQQVLDLEREAFVSLCGEPKSQERMQHMLMKNKPLRN